LRPWAQTLGLDGQKERFIRQQALGSPAPVFSGSVNGIAISFDVERRI